jgi:hypothetical protein
MPRSYQVTPKVLGRRRATQALSVRPASRHSSLESARRRPENQPQRSDVTAQTRAIFPVTAVSTWAPARRSQRSSRPRRSRRPLAQDKAGAQAGGFASGRRTVVRGHDGDTMPRAHGRAVAATAQPAGTRGRRCACLAIGTAPLRAGVEPRLRPRRRVDVFGRCRVRGGPGGSQPARVPGARRVNATLGPGRSRRGCRVEAVVGDEVRDGEVEAVGRASRQVLLEPV